MKTTSIACISGDHQKTKLTRCGPDLILSPPRFPLSITAFKDGIKCLFPDMGMCDSSNLFTLYYMVYTCILGDNDAII